MRWSLQLAVVTLALVSCACTGHAAALTMPCVTTTKLTGCAECLPADGATGARCYFCNYLTAPVFNSSRIITTCGATSTNCTAAGPKDINCERCSGTKCTRCKAGWGVNSATNKCATLSTAGVCRNSSRNAACAACNPDGSCFQCSNTTKLIMPANSIYLDAGYPETQCNTSAEINREAKNITLANAYMPTNCSEVDSDFRCAACRAGSGPVRVSTTSTSMKCVRNTSTTRYPSGCLIAKPYMRYCTKCNTNGTACLPGYCTGSRSLDMLGYCSLNCKGFFGIVCKTCTASACTALDPSWLGRRRR